MNILCLISKSPEKRWCEFLSKINNYKIYIIVDDNNFDLSKFNYEYKKINFIKIDDEKCKLNGYVNAEFKSDKIVNAWDKALYYFCKNDINYNFIWFIEEDVFLPTSKIIYNLDNKYPNGDLLCREHRKITIKDYKQPIKFVFTNKLITKFLSGIILNN